MRLQSRTLAVALLTLGLLARPALSSTETQGLPEAPSPLSIQDCGIAHPTAGLGVTVALSQALAPTQGTASAPCLDCGEVVAYTAFDGTPYTLTRYKGAFVDLLIPDSWIQANVLSDADRHLFLERADFFYAHSMELLGREPTGLRTLRSPSSIQPADSVAATSERRASKY